MAGDGNYLSEMLQAGRDSAPDVIGSLNRGMQFGQNIQNIPVQNMYRQQQMQQMEKQKQVDAALKQYGQTGDIKGLQSLDPEIAVRVSKATDYINSQPSASVKAMEAVTGEFGRIWPMVNSKNWSGPQGIKARIMKSHPDLPPDTLPPDNATDDQLKQFGTMLPMFNATLEGLKKGPKVLKPNDILMGQQGPIYQAPPAPTSEKDKAIIEQKRALIGKYGADIELKIKDLGIKQARLDFDKTKPTGKKYDEATAFDKATTYANKAVTDQMVTEAANKRLADQDPKWAKRPTNESDYQKWIAERKTARDKIMPQVREELTKHLTDSYMNERRQKAGAGKGGGTAPAKSLQSMTTEELRQAIQQQEAGGGVVGEEEE